MKYFYCIFVAIVAILISLSFISVEQACINNENAEVPEVYKKIYGATSITSDGNFITIKTKGVPDHKSAYYNSSDPLYQKFDGTTFGGSIFRKNPNNIIEHYFTFKIPLNPQEAINHRATPLGPIGVALNGVPFFNQYAGHNRPLSSEMASFDQYWGHPAQRGDYHYHVEPLYLTNVKATKFSLLGFLLDGFPVYGPEENGKTVTNDMLDTYHGHVAVTADFPKGVYHYHISNTDPYINGSGFWGTPGSISR